MRLMKEKIVIGLGVILILLPLTGFPRSWKTIFTVVIGVVVAYMGALFLRIAQHKKAHANSETRTETFTETV